MSPAGAGVFTALQRLLPNRNGPLPRSHAATPSQSAVNDAGSAEERSAGAAAGSVEEDAFAAAAAHAATRKRKRSQMRAFEAAVAATAQRRPADADSVLDIIQAGAGLEEIVTDAAGYLQLRRKSLPELSDSDALSHAVASLSGRAVKVAVAAMLAVDGGDTHHSVLELLSAAVLTGVAQGHPWALAGAVEALLCNLAAQGKHGEVLNTAQQLHDVAGEDIAAMVRAACRGVSFSLRQNTTCLPLYGLEACD